MERAIFFSFGFSCSPHGFPANKADLAGFSQMLDRAEVASLQGAPYHTCVAFVSNCRAMGARFRQDPVGV